MNTIPKPTPPQMWRAATLADVSDSPWPDEEIAIINTERAAEYATLVAKYEVDLAAWEATPVSEEPTPACAVPAGPEPVAVQAAAPVPVMEPEPTLEPTPAGPAPAPKERPKSGDRHRNKMLAYRAPERIHQRYAGNTNLITLQLDLADAHGITAGGLGSLVRTVGGVEHLLGAACNRAGINEATKGLVLAMAECISKAGKS